MHNILRILYSCKCIKYCIYVRAWLRSYSLHRVRGTTIAAELAFVRCLIYFKNDVQRTIASLLTAIVSCPCRMLPQSRESIQSAPD